MSNKEKLIQYIHNLTNEEAETIISFLKSTQTPVEAVPHPPLCNSQQDQVTAS